ncbi:MAG: hypothetical protein L6Q55_00985 [Azonexus sp.]|nr:hypothetical protein [Azonexus sp.]MCK6410983.1 hypothetical protein [Azonexus sp.]
MKFLKWMGARAGEASTWRGLGLFLAAMGILPADAVEPLIAAGVAIAGAVDIVRRED